MPARESASTTAGSLQGLTMASTLKKLHEGKAERSQATLTVAGASEAGEEAATEEEEEEEEVRGRCSLERREGVAAATATARLLLLFFCGGEVDDFVVFDYCCV